jgi:hypothetical protein
MPCSCSPLALAGTGERLCTEVSENTWCKFAPHGLFDAIRIFWKLFTPTYGGWLTDPDRRNAVRVALNLVPFAGIAFLWFVGVIRSRLGAQEDQFLATVLLGSGLLFVACLFGAAALVGPEGKELRRGARRSRYRASRMVLSA